ncbi:MAG: ABC transporter ATP-binding protein [Acidimicrobiaceae bacterium]|nr:ABC transporter ATP-binding protein [Acidimicrobiaceae bacterium]MXV87250.1 ABC transporter ATP-binding protein [Acidimicrobiales bacterium]MCY3607263.1 ABC transporter ATP-binding protein [Acidimicrobiaceae bacterium]MCY3949679.1 ABC transporter ATP-binding protein [Acidimicrobiaceae bacterium]MDE0676053.1 ABC transporter ATP-binding protein [Acidimicrobiaceae bacterium]
MTAEARLAIEVTGLHKRYGEVEAVTGVDLSVRTGEVVAFLGPNGAGKTTTVEILEGLRTRTSGDVHVLGVDPAEATADWRERIGVVLQGAKHEGDFTAAEIVTMWSAYYRSPRPTAEVLELVGLAEAAGTRTRRLSGGQQQRLAVALALVGDPELVFLDEPTTGFDPAARREAWQTIDGLRSLGVTVLLTTHYMDEADRLADRIAVISRGRIVADGTAPELAAQVAMPSHISWDAAELSTEALPDRLRDLLRSQDAWERPALVTRDVGGVVRELLVTAEAVGTRLDSLAVQPPTLEDTYLALTGDTSSGDGS